jgi:hypothetical protein
LVLANGDLRGGGRVIGGALSDDTFLVTDRFAPGGGDNLERVAGREGGRGGSVSETERALGGGGGAVVLAAFRTGRGGAGRLEILLEGLAGGGGGGALPGVVGIAGTFLGACGLLRDGMAGAGRTVGEVVRAGDAGVDRGGGAGERSFSVEPLRGGLIGRGGAGIIREGNVGAVRLGGTGAAAEGFGGGTDIVGRADGGGAGGVAIDPSRLGIAGGLPRDGGFAAR